MRVKIKLKSALLYAAYALCLVCLNCVLPNVPLSLGLCFAMLICGTNAVAVPLLYALSSIITLDWVTMLISLFECGFLTAVTLIYRRSGKKIRAEAVAYLAVALAPFVAFSRWQGVPVLEFIQNPYLIRAVAALAVCLFAFFCMRAVYTLLFRVCRCLPRTDEAVCLAVFAAVCGAGVFNLAGLNAYLCLSAGLTAFTVRLTKSPFSLIIACIIGAPCAIITANFSYLTAFVMLAALLLLFAQTGRWAVVAVCLISSAAYFYFTGLFATDALHITLWALALFCCCLAAGLPSEKKLVEVLRVLTVKKILPKAEQTVFAENVSDKLFRTGEVFREIECAFNALDDGIDAGALKQRVLTESKERLCKNCERRANCAHTQVYKGFAFLVEAGCAKGKVTLVDLPVEVTVNCTNVTKLVEVMNKLFYDYRRLTLEAENAKNGRKLLAGQARGVAEVLKNTAVDLKKSADEDATLAAAIQRALAESGVSCPEIRVTGGANRKISLTAVGDAPVSVVKACLERVCGSEFILADKVDFDGQKCVYFFVNPPKFDAAFGVAYAIKDGERQSGDTHSVVRINEHGFLMVLSDGMGSGEYAQKVSSTAISLIEAFYRAEMPAETVLDTINKLLCFNRDERFTCIDVAAVDLNTLTASFIKIGAPAAIIVRKGEIKILESHSLPLGIIESLHPTTCAEQLKADDVITFMSDGVTSAFSSLAELYEFLQTLKPLNPQALADSILAAAKSRVLGTPDDMTVLCVRVYARNAE